MQKRTASLVRPAKRRGGGSHLWGFGKLTEDLVPGASAECQVYAGDPPAASAETITVWDFALYNNVTLAAGTMVQWAKSDRYDRYYVTNAYAS